MSAKILAWTEGTEHTLTPLEVRLSLSAPQASGSDYKAACLAKRVQGPRPKIVGKGVLVETPNTKITQKFVVREARTTTRLAQSDTSPNSKLSDVSFVGILQQISRMKSRNYSGRSHSGFDEIDVATYAEALVAVFLFLPEEESISLFLDCLEPGRSGTVKICAIKAATTFTTRHPVFLGSGNPRRNSSSLSRRVMHLTSAKFYEAQQIRQSWGYLSCGVSVQGQVLHVQNADRQRPYAALHSCILALLQASPDHYIANIENTDVEGWDSISAQMPLTDPYCKMIEVRMKNAMPMSSMCIVKRLLLARLDPDSQRLWIHVAHQLVGCYHRKSEYNHAHGMQFNEDHVPAFAMCEIAFLVSLASASSDVSQLAAQGFRLIAQAERQPEIWQLLLFSSNS
ncbi:hypothetical protein EDD22DRAFT_1017900 [Suillus occidentalis]|nr:hypothetical protein EDD22DRAFT_1017900 [Suillus occidentalis]